MGGELGNIAEKLCLEDEFPFLVFLRRLVGLVVFPADSGLAVAAGDVADDVLACGHGSFEGFARIDVDYGVEEVGFAVLAAEVLGC